jgi:hypothetical protein
MYIRTPEGLGLRLGQPTPPPKSQQPALRKQFISNVVAYKDAKDKCQSTKYSIYVPSALRNPKEIDMLVFFHGLLSVCDKEHNFDPDRLIKTFQLDLQVASDPQLALAVPIVLWNSADRSQGIIRAAWSAAYLNAFVEEVLDQISKSYGVRTKLGRLILAGHSAAYDILTPLAEQFDCGVAETNKGALAKLGSVVAMDTTYRTKDAKALEQWARKLPAVKINLILSKADPSVGVWQDWEKTKRKKLTGYEKRPENLRVFHQIGFGHCALPRNYLVTYLYSS